VKGKTGIKAESNPQQTVEVPKVNGLEYANPLNPEQSGTLVRSDDKMLAESTPELVCKSFVRTNA
jgi:hypothetical protein